MAQFGRALRSGRRGRRFESCHFDYLAGAPETLEIRFSAEIIHCCRVYDAEKVILFGSRAKGTATERSDIDIAVSGVKSCDVLDLEEKLQDIPTLYTIDLVDLDTCRNQLLLEDIRQYGREIYKKI